MKTAGRERAVKKNRLKDDDLQPYEDLYGVSFLFMSLLEVNLTVSGCHAEAENALWERRMTQKNIIWSEPSSMTLLAVTQSLLMLEADLIFTYEASNRFERCCIAGPMADNTTTNVLLSTKPISGTLCPSDITHCLRSSRQLGRGG